MKLPSKKYLFAAGFVLLMIAVYVIFSLSREPYYKGQPLSYWLVQCARVSDVRGSDEDPRSHAAIMHFGTNSIPWLLKYVNYQPPAWWYSDSGWSHLLRRIDYFGEAVGEKQTRALGAQRAFEALGPRAAGAIPELNRLIAGLSTNDTPHAVFALAGIGELALPSLCAALTNRQLQCRGVVGVAIASLGTNARPALPLLLQCAQEPNQNAAGGAIYALGKLHCEPDLVIPVILARLNDPQLYTRANAVTALGAFGARASNAIPALINALNDSDPRVAGRAQKAILNIDSNALARLKTP